MSDTKETPDAAPKKKGKMKTILIGGVALLVLVGGGVGAGVYASSAGLIGGGGHAAEAEDGKPKLVPKSEQKHATEGGEGGEVRRRGRGRDRNRRERSPEGDAAATDGLIQTGELATAAFHEAEADVAATAASVMADAVPAAFLPGSVEPAPAASAAPGK